MKVSWVPFGVPQCATKSASTNPGFSMHHKLIHRTATKLEKLLLIAFRTFDPLQTISDLKAPITSLEHRFFCVRVHAAQDTNPCIINPSVTVSFGNIYFDALRYDAKVSFILTVDGKSAVDVFYSFDKKSDRFIFHVSAVRGSPKMLIVKPSTPTGHGYAVRTQVVIICDVGGPCS